MIRKNELLRLLASVPGDPIVVIWQGEAAEACDGCDADIEQAVVCDDAKGAGQVLVLGMAIPVGELPCGETVWGAP